MERTDMIRERLTEVLSPESLEVVDRSHEHAGHEGAKGGGGHFDVNIVADAFAGMNSVARHRAVYEALGDAMRAEIHDLSIKAYTPDEFCISQGSLALPCRSGGPAAPTQQVWMGFNEWCG